MLILLSAFPERTAAKLLTVSTKTSTLFSGWISGLLEVSQRDFGDAHIGMGVFWDERIQMMQWWANYLDELRTELRLSVASSANSQ